METHRVHEELLRREVRILVVGCGGTGSAILGGLPYLYQALLAWGHPGGLQVTVMDDDTISAVNCVRQPFGRSEIGMNKAIVLVNRINLFWGLAWRAIPQVLTPQTLAPAYAGYGERHLRPAIVTGCVDTRAARAVIAESVAGSSTTGYWLDLGNHATGVQFVLGEPLNARNKRSRMRLRTAAELYEELINPDLDDDHEPNCSAIEALDRQEPFVNTALAQHALALLARLLRYGQVSHHGGFVEVASARCVPSGIDPTLWRRVKRRRNRKPREGASNAA
ncbi:MAG: PRTRC system ThiF family protein [Terriglobia bacterium]